MLELVQVGQVLLYGILYEVILKRLELNDAKEIYHRETEQMGL